MSAELRVRLISLSQRLRSGKVEPSEVATELDAIAFGGVGGKREADVRSAVDDARRALAGMVDEPQRAALLKIRAADALARAGEHASPSR